jgi:hypothetical protein
LKLIIIGFLVHVQTLSLMKGFLHVSAVIVVPTVGVLKFQLLIYLFKKSVLSGAKVCGGSRGHRDYAQSYLEVFCVRKLLAKS